MNIEITKKSAREMAKRLQSLTAAAALTHSQSLEILSQVLGYRNWDTLSAAMVKAEPTLATFKLEKPVVLYLAAFSCDEYGSGPSWTKVVLSQAFMDELLRAQRRVQELDLSMLELNVAPDDWSTERSSSLGAVLNLREECLRVGETAFWFRATPKHCDYAVESRMLEIETLVNALSRKNEGKYLVWYKDVLVYDAAGDTDQLVDMLIEDGELSEDYLPA